MTAPGTLAVLGAGVMGSGIAHSAALAGWSVRLQDAVDGVADAGAARVASLLEGGVRRGKLTAEAAEGARRRLSVATSERTC